MGFAQNSLDTRAVSRYGASFLETCIWLFHHEVNRVRSSVLRARNLSRSRPGRRLIGRDQRDRNRRLRRSLAECHDQCVETQTGLKRTAITNGTGQFRVVGLSPATYDVSVQMAGFATEIRRERHGCDRADGRLRFQDETVAGSDGGRSDGPAASGGNGTRQPGGQNLTTVHRRPAHRPARLPYVYVARARGLRFHPAGGRPGFQSQANPTKRTVVLRQQWPRKQHNGRRRRDFRRQRWRAA